MAAFCVLVNRDQHLVETCSAFFLLAPSNSSPGTDRQNDGGPDLPHDFRKYMPSLCSVMPAVVGNAAPLVPPASERVVPLLLEPLLSIV